jgi:hypothetical protein
VGGARHERQRKARSYGSQVAGRDGTRPRRKLAIKVEHDEIRAKARLDHDVNFMIDAG